MEFKTNTQGQPSQLIRAEQVLSLLPISRSQWWRGVKIGLYPKPVKLGPNISAWRLLDIEHLIQNGINIDGGA